jgi:hypothetical protein
MDPREGDERLSAAKSDDLDRFDDGVPKPTKSDSKDKVRRKASGDLGRALKSVYDSTLAEDVPDDFLDLLGKLD